MGSTDTIQQQTYKMIDDLKSICTNYGLGNSGNEYKIITEAFLYKFLNDKFFYEVRQSDAKYKGMKTGEIEERLRTLTADEFDLLAVGLPENTAVIKPDQFISTLFNQKSAAKFHETFDKALAAIAEENRAVFSVRAGEGTSVSLFETLSNYVVQTEKRDAFCSAIIDKLAGTNFETMFGQKYDFFADIFEYLIKDYNKDFGKYGEYYTPHSIAQIIAKILAPEGDKNVRIYDPAAGSGTLILALAHEIGEENCTLYTQDISQKSNEILRLNLILNNLVHSLPNVIQEDTLLNPRHLNKNKTAIATFEYVVSNPPFNMDFSETRDTLAGDNYKGRFFAGVPNIPNKKKDGMAIYQLFIQHILRSMDEKRGKAAVVVPTGFLTAATGIPLKIREYIVSHKLLRGVISMPSNIFANTGTNVSVLFLDVKGAPNDQALLVDASNLGTKQKIEGTKNQRTYLSDAEIARIIETFNARREEDDFSVLVNLDDIAKKKCSFSAGQYFKVKIEYVDITPEEFRAKMDGFRNELREAFQEGRELEKEIERQLGELVYEGTDGKER